MTPDIGLANWLKESASRTPERQALHFEGRDWRYADLQRDVEDIAGRLAARGVAPGERVAFLGHNRPYLERGVSMQQGYGLTETSPMVSFLAPEYALAKVGSSGRTPPFVEVDAEGFLTICDRIKDMIITGGENVYSAQIESELMRHPAVAEVGVIGEPDPRWGERVVAVAALKPGRTLSLEELRGFAAGRLAAFKSPKRLEIVAALPRNATGKILKRKLREGLVEKP